MVRIKIFVFLLISLFLIGCTDKDFCSPGSVDLLESECPAETIGPTFCRSWLCRNVNDLEDSIALSSSIFDCEVIECNFLRCRDIMTDEITDFTDIIPLGSGAFSTLIDSDPNQEFECLLPIP